MRIYGRHLIAVILRRYCGWLFNLKGSYRVTICSKGGTEAAFPEVSTPGRYAPPAPIRRIQAIGPPILATINRTDLDTTAWSKAGVTASSLPVVTSGTMTPKSGKTRSGIGVSTTIGRSTRWWCTRDLLMVRLLPPTPLTPVHLCRFTSNRIWTQMRSNDL